MPGDTYGAHLEPRVESWPGVVPGLFLEVVMHRQPVNKYKSARGFRRDVRTVKALNMAGPMRGGIRL